MTNSEIKNKIKESGIYQYNIANYIGITEHTFCKWFHRPLTEQQQSKILNAIEDIKAGAAVE